MFLSFLRAAMKELAWPVPLSYLLMYVIYYGLFMEQIKKEKKREKE